MPNNVVNILNLPVAVSVSGAEYFPLVQGGTTKRAALALLESFSTSGGVQDANIVFAGPASGAAAGPTFRNLVLADVAPALLDSALANGETIQVNLGKSTSTYQSAVLGYTYNSSTPYASYASLGLPGSPTTLTVTGLDDAVDYVADKVGVAITTPHSRLHVAAYDLNAPSLTYHSNEILSLDSIGNGELVFGFQPSDPFPFWMQVRNAGSGVLPFEIMPLGGLVTVGCKTDSERQLLAPLPTKMLIADGTNASPQSGAASVLVSRRQQTSTHDYAAIDGLNAGTGSGQPLGVRGWARQSGSGDCVGVMGIAEGYAPNKAAFAFYGGANAFDAAATAIQYEGTTGNYTGTNGAYDPNIGVNRFQGFDIDYYGGPGANLGSVAIQIRSSGLAGGRWDVGVGFMKGDLIKTADMQTDTDAMHILYAASGSHVNGINLSGATFSGDAFKSSGFAVDGDGNIYAAGTTGNLFSNITNPTQVLPLESFFAGAVSTANVGIYATYNGVLPEAGLLVETYINPGATAGGSGGAIIGGTVVSDTGHDPYAILGLISSTLAGADAYGAGVWAISRRNAGANTRIMQISAENVDGTHPGHGLFINGITAANSALVGIRVFDAVNSGVVVGGTGAAVIPPITYAVESTSGVVRYKVDDQGSIWGGGVLRLNYAQFGTLDGVSLTSLANSAQMWVGYNRSGGGGEYDFITNRNAGSVGGFRFYDYTNAGVLNLLATMAGDGTFNTSGYLNDDPSSAISYLPIGNALTTLSSFVMTGERQSGTVREFMASIGMTHAIGNSASTYNKDAVTLYLGHDAQLAAGDGWALNLVMNMAANLANDNNFQGIELDFNNVYKDYTSLSPLAAGMSITGAGTYLSSAALLIAGTISSLGNDPIWTMGIALVADSIRDYSIYDATNSVIAHFVQGTHTHGVDLSGATISGNAWASPGNVVITGAGQLGILNTSPQALLHAGAGADAPTVAHTIYASLAGATSIGARDSTNNVEAMLRAGTGAVDVGAVTAHAVNFIYNNGTIAQLTSLGITILGSLILQDGIAAPSTIGGFASIYVDAADGDLKIKFGDGTVKTIVVDT